MAGRCRTSHYAVRKLRPVTHVGDPEKAATPICYLMALMIRRRRRKEGKPSIMLFIDDDRRAFLIAEGSMRAEIWRRGEQATWHVGTYSAPVRDDVRDDIAKHLADLIRG